MAFEKKMAAVPLQHFIADGTTAGIITIADSSLFKVKQQITLVATNLPNLDLEVKRVISATQLIVGPRKSNINDKTDVSLYRVDRSAGLFAPEQVRNLIPEQDVPVVTYEEEPAVAQRVIPVDRLGNKIDQSNPLPVGLEGSTATLLNNLLAMQVAGIPAGGFIVNNDGFFVTDNDGNLIKVG